MEQETSSLLSPSQIIEMQRQFQDCRQYPKQLVTQNKPALQHAYVSVPLESWEERIHNLQSALRATDLPTHIRIRMLAEKDPLSIDRVDQFVYRAFEEKYNELAGLITYSFNNFFPYKISRSNQKLLIFEKLQQHELFEYVIQRHNMLR